MLTVIKVLFFFVAGIFLVSYLNDNADLPKGSLFGQSNDSSSELSDRSVYSRSYDTNHDGTVNDEEYRQGELRRIEEEVELLEEAVAKKLEISNRSSYADVISLSASNARTNDHRKEYLTLSVRSGNNTTPINITGWQVRSLVSDRGARIGKGVVLLEGNRPRSKESDIFLAPGDRAILNTDNAVGINTSFLTNSCMGYWDYDRFYPTISGSCPLLEDVDLEEHGLGFSDFRREREYDACMDAIEDVRSCEIVRSTDSSLTDDCRDFIREYANYDGCVELNKYEEGFYQREWRIFLNSSRDLWRTEREAIVLLDAEGRVVDLVKY